MLVKNIFTGIACLGLCTTVSFADQNVDVPFRIKAHVSEMTCKEFIVLEDSHKSMMVAWVDGYHANAKSLNPIDVSIIGKIIPVITESCNANPDNKVQDDIMKAIDHVGYTDDK